MPHANFKEGTKVCPRSDCASQGKPQPIANFSHRKETADGFRNECRACQAAESKRAKQLRDSRIDPTNPILLDAEKTKEKLTQIKQEDKRLGTAISILTAKKPANVPVTHTEEIAGNLMQSFGGPRAFADKLVSAIDGADNAGHKIRGLLGAATIFKDASLIQQANAQDMDLVSDEELNARIKQLLQEQQNAGAIDVEYEVHDKDLDTNDNPA